MPAGKILICIGCAAALWAQEAAPPAEQPPAPATTGFSVPQGTRIPLQLLGAVSTKTAQVGDRVYLQTNFPILGGGRIVIPPGSYVTGTVTYVKRAGKVKGKSELFVRFDSLTLPNGVTRDFRGNLGNIDGSNPGKVDRAEGKVTGDGSKGTDAMRVGEASMWGMMVGGLASQSGTGAGIGAAAGAAAGVVGVLLTRGPDAVLERGSTVEMVLDRTLQFSAEELSGAASEARPPATVPAPGKPSTGSFSRRHPGDN